VGSVSQFAPAAAARRAQNPVEVYLSGLSASSRRTMGQRLNTIAKILDYSDPYSVEWRKLRSDHVVAIRQSLVDGGLAPATINGLLSAIRGVARAAWDLGWISGDEYIRIANVRLRR
jgi:integrase/recombinase XerD